MARRSAVCLNVLKINTLGLAIVTMGNTAAARVILAVDDISTYRIFIGTCMLTLHELVRVALTCKQARRWVCTLLAHHLTPTHLDTLIESLPYQHGRTIEPISWRQEDDFYWLVSEHGDNVLAVCKECDHRNEWFMANRDESPCERTTAVSAAWSDEYREWQRYPVFNAAISYALSRWEWSMREFQVSDDDDDDDEPDAKRQRI